MSQQFEVLEDESGKWLYPRWMVVDADNCKEVAGPFDTETEAEDAAAEMTMICAQGE